MTLKETVDSIGRDVVEAAQRNLGATRKIGGKTRRRVASGKLKDGLAFKNLTRYNNPVLQFGVDDQALKKYADVIEYGRRPGAKPPPVDPIIQWMKIKPIRLRNKEGGFVKSTESGIRSAAFLIARSIGKKGIVGIKYYTEALESVLEKRGPELLEAYGKEIENRLNLK
jgi:hypothetical protein